MVPSLGVVSLILFLYIFQFRAPKLSAGQIVCCVPAHLHAFCQWTFLQGIYFVSVAFCFQFFLFSSVHCVASGFLPHMWKWADLACYCWYTSSEGVFVFGFLLFCIVSWLVGFGFPVVVMCLDPCVQVSYCGHCPLLYFHACAFPSFFSLRSTYSLCHVVVLLPELTFFVFSSRHASCCKLLWVWAFILVFGDRGIVSSRSCNFVTVGVGGCVCGCAGLFVCVYFCPLPL